MLHSQPQHRGSVTHIPPPYSPSPVSTAQSEVPASHAPQAATGSAETLFWNPLPNMAGMGVPILARNSYPVGPMDLDNMLGSADEWDRFGRDGFKMSETWNQDHANAYGGSGEEGYPQVTAVTNGYTSAEVAQYSGGTQMGGQAFDASWWSGEGNMDR